MGRLAVLTMGRLRALALIGLATVVAAGCTGSGDPPVDPGSTTSPVGPTSTVTSTTGSLPASTTTMAESCPVSAFELGVVEVGSEQDPGDFDLDAASVVYSAGEPYSGPNAIAVGPDGAIWIADTEAVRLGTPRLLRIGCEGPPGQIVDLAPHGVASALDLVVDNEGVWVADIDVARDRQRILKVDATGALLAEHDIPEGYRLFDGFIGLDLGEDGSILLLRAGDPQPHAVVAADGTFLDPPVPVPWTSNGVEVVLETPELGAHEGVIQIGPTSLPVTMPNFYGGAVFLGTTLEGDTLVTLTEIHDGDLLLVDETVWRITPTGEITGRGRVPIAERYLFIEHPLAVTPTGEVVVMLALADELKVFPMDFTPDLEPVLPPP